MVNLGTWSTSFPMQGSEFVCSCGGGYSYSFLLVQSTTSPYRTPIAPHSFSVGGRHLGNRDRYDQLVLGANLAARPRVSSAH